MPNVTPRITGETAKNIKDLFKTLNSGCEFILNSWPDLYIYTLCKLTEKLCETDFDIIKKVLQNTKCAEPQFAGNYLRVLLNKEGYIALADFVQTLTPFEKACLEIWAMAQNMKK